MCLILFSLQQHPRYPLIIAANRDENYQRPSAPLAFWPDAPQVAGGRDLEAGGTWLGMTSHGRWAALTNYRQAGSYRVNAPSRGHLVSRYLLDTVSPERYIDSIADTAGQYNGFNLLVGLGPRVFYFSNRADRPTLVSPGSHGLSNHLLDTPWPKVTAGRQTLQALPDLPPEALSDVLLEALRARRLPPDAELPDTGVGLGQERMLAPPFILSETYGTRASTVILLDDSGCVTMVEHAFGPLGEPAGAHALRFRIEVTAPAPATTPSV